jgi:small subunit ribosomal protein S2
MPYVTERWSGGMLTNFGTIRRTIKKMATIDRMKTDGTFENMSKRERLQVSRQREKMEKNLGSIADLSRLPSALFIVDITKEHIAVAEAKKLNIPTFAMVDTNSDPTKVDFPIPANDDATKSIELIVDTMIAAINEGIEERKNDKNAVDENDAEEGAEETAVEEEAGEGASEEKA